MILSTVLLATVILILRSSNYLRKDLREATVENFEELQITTMTNIAEYLRRELFTPLYELDIERITLSIKDLRRGMPVSSVRIADFEGKVLTDGSWENPSYGMQLNLDLKELASTPVLIESVEAGHRVTFQIGIEGYTAGHS